MTAEQISVAIAEQKKEIGSLKHRVQDLEVQQDAINRLTLSTEKLATNMEYMLKEQEKQGKRIECLEQNPAKRLDKIEIAIVTAIISGLATFVFSKLL